MRPFQKPEKTKKPFKRVVGASCSDAQRVVHPATREQDASNLARVQRERALKPPPLKLPDRCSRRS